jgi:hypothetical protein
MQRADSEIHAVFEIKPSAAGQWNETTAVSID